MMVKFKYIPMLLMVFLSYNAIMAQVMLGKEQQEEKEKVIYNPKQILPGTKEEIYSKTDTFWVMSQAQMAEYALDQLRMEKADSLFKLFQAEINTFQRVIKQKNEIIQRMIDEKKDLAAKLEACENEPKKKRKKKK